MKNRRMLAMMLGVLAPSILLLVADVIIGDHELFKLMNTGLVSPALDFACVYLSPILFSVFFVLAWVALCLSANSSAIATSILSVADGVLSYGLGSLIKLLVRNPRPEALAAARVISEARIIGFWHTSTFSFPSTTTMLAFGLTLPILFEKRRAGLVLVALSYFIGFAVIYTGFHFPLDVAGGIFYSLTMTISTNWLKKPLGNTISKHTPTGPQSTE